jgi:hypothetical protein
MPAARTYSNVCIEELTSGGRTIENVATSIAAFVGWVRVWVQSGICILNPSSIGRE